MASDPTLISMIIVVLPAYNEEEALGKLLPAIAAVLPEAGLDYQVIVVDDGSTDRTAQLVTAFQPRMPVRLLQHSTNQGLAAAMRTGLTAAAKVVGEEDIVVTMDADNTHDPGLIPDMVGKISEGADIVIASRFQPGSRVVGVPWHRQLFSWGASLLFRLLLPMPGVRDYTCGYRAYQSQVLHEAFERYGEGLISQQGFSCMVDLLLRLGALPVVITEVPMVLRYDLKPGASKMKIGATVLETLKLIVKRRLGIG